MRDEQAQAGQPGIDSAAWTGSAAPMPAHSAPILLTLDPKPPADALAEVFGQQEALAVLKGMVGGVLRAATATDAPAGTLKTGVFALFGRYGQGKTTLLRRLYAEFNGSCPNEGARFRRLRVLEFDVATHNPEKLSYEFDQLIADWRLRSRLLVVLGTVAVIALVWLLRGMPPLDTLASAKPASVLAQWPGFVTGASAAALLSLMAPVLRAFAQQEQVVHRRIAAAWNYGRAKLFGQIVADAFHGPPDLLIIDNLDRAVPDQQRAFLLALRRHRAYLPPVVVVAFDETPLTLSDANPDTPQELLSKAFTSAVRLYPMTGNDAALLVIDMLEQLEAHDPEAEGHPLRCLQHAHVAGDLARILLFHRRHSVRFCRQFVNVVATAASALHIDDPGDFSALMRLHGLFEFLPWIRSDPVALGDMLEREETEKLMDYAASLAGKPELSAETVASVTAFMAGTRHMQPVYNGWRAFIGRFGDKARQPKPLSGPALPIWNTASGKAALRNAWIYTDLQLADEPRPELRAREYHKRLQRGPPPLENGEPHELQDRLVYGFFVQRLWQADANFLEQQDAYNDLYVDPSRMDRPYWMPTLASPEIEQPSSEVEQLDPAMAELLTRLYLQIAWPLPPRILGLYPGAVAAASAVGRDRGESAVTLWLERLLRQGAERVPGFPVQFGQYLGTSTDGDQGPFFGLVIDCLPSLPVYLEDGSAVDWMATRKVTDLLGRIFRDGYDGALYPVRPLISTVVASEPDAAALRQLMQCVACALPLPAGHPDGPWRRSAIEELAILFEPSVSGSAAFLSALTESSKEPIAGNLLLLALAARNATAVATIRMQWDPPAASRASYADMQEMCEHRFCTGEWASP